MRTTLVITTDTSAGMLAKILVAMRKLKVSMMDQTMVESGDSRVLTLVVRGVATDA